MKSRTSCGALCLALLVATGAIPGNGETAHAQAPSTRATLTAHAGTIVGTIRDGNDKPIPAARLRLRELTAGRIVMVTRGDQEGQFRFSGVPAGQYLVELVDERGSVLGVSKTLNTVPAETMVTYIRLGARVPWYTGFFTNAAVAAVSSAEASSSTRSS